jgi:hypothetical protein
MYDVALVGLDTSHAEAFASVIAEMDQMTVHGVWDSNDVRSPADVDAFCARHDATRYASVEDLAAAVDAAMVLTVDWELHAPLATTCLDADLPTMIDKPVTGSVANVERIRAHAGATPLFGGSAIPYHTAFESFPLGGEARSLYAAGFNDFFYYRVHLTDTVRFLADADWTHVEPSDDPGSTVDVRFENGVHATLRFDGSPDGGTFSVLDVGETTNVAQIESDRETLSELYTAFLERFQSVVAGERDDSARIFDAATLLLAVELALDADQPVTPTSDALAAVRIESREFVVDYAPYY